jgi:hypothetical protein
MVMAVSGVAIEAVVIVAALLFLAFVLRDA